ncbi:uncharacterized protein HMPREF1541_02564 [Cyphellophora europaea CBS 101466]|uniref:Zn(2)-C6 fungal-type domain-containing protein n=1 Tax=Cyphellophora europaea (strain CBS 101466) TaxID=1220924 RepID=W2S498_CYPE1|nr:uncharacterized protein HMPREF1541_02564 [Cyphellophora europaea CBS 101466]ETN43405.1 hypothetical protein HMPREF1541_02564 [Cyphellophora europaea CBS 101466]
MPYKKVRTGCRTCKVRKLKCDETKPACLRCARARFKCEGYSIFVPLCEQRVVRNSEALSKQLRPVDSVIFYRTLRRMVELDEVDHIAYDFCRRSTVHELSARNKFWTCTVLASAEQEPAILHALLALTAAHKARTEQIQGVVSRVDHDNHALVTSHYYKAVQLLRRHLLDHRKQHAEYVLIGCLILLGCDLLQGRYREALIHLQNGRHILQSSRPGATTSLSIKAQPVSTLDQLALEFASLDIQSVNFGSSKPHFELVDNPSSPRGLSLLEAFDGLEDAERFLLILHNSFYQFTSSHTDPGSNAFWSNTKSPEAILEQERLLCELRHWKHIFDKSALRPLKALGPSSGHSEAHSRYSACRLMHSYLTVVTKTALDIGNEAVFDVLLPQFSTMITICEELVSTSPKITLDIGIIQPLFVIGCFCRHPDLRRRCLQVLNKCGVEGHWDARLVKLLTLRRMQVEEEEAGYSYNADEPMPEDPELLSKTFPSHARYTLSFALFRDPEYRQVEVQLLRKGYAIETPTMGEPKFEVNKMTVDWPPAE